MTETPREYKKRIDEKREQNEKNRDKLIQRIEKYELVDEKYKAKIKQEILSNFEKNEKAEKGSEQYKAIVSELEDIDKKYGELADLKEKLKSKKQEKAGVDKEIRGSKLDGSDETTLKMQWTSVKELKKRLEILEPEIKELENDIEYREQEIKEIEDSYGEIVEREQEGIQENDSEIENPEEQVVGKPETLKEVHEQTIKELWKKDKTRKDIIKILDDGTGIDDELKERIKKGISDKFFEYYEEKQGSLRMKSARFVKNELKIKKGKLEEPKDQNLDEIERLEDIFGILYIGKSEAGGILGTKIKEIDMIKKVCGKPVYKAKDENGKIYVIRGKEKYWEGSGEVMDVKVIGGEIVLKIKDSDGYYRVFRGGGECYGVSKLSRDKYKKIYDIHEVDGKPIFLALDDDGYYSIILGHERYTCYYEKGIIKENLRKKQYTHTRTGSRIIGWEK